MDEYVRSVSHTWQLKVTKIRRPAGGQKGSATKSHRWRRFGRRNPADWIRCDIKWAGGSSGWVVVRARGETNAYPADTWLLNLVMDINQCH